MELATWLGPAIGATAAVIAAGVAAWIGAANRKALAQSERRANIDTQLGDKRRELYMEILKPFLISITPDTIWTKDPKTKGKDRRQSMERAMLNVRYREAMFQLTFVGTDEVVQALNDVMQHIFKAEPGDQPGSTELLRLLARLLLAIRRGAGNDATKLDEWAMLEPFLTDAREQRDRQLRASLRPAAPRPSSSARR